MYQRIEKLSESPCSKCGSKKKCDKKLKKNDNFLILKIKYLVIKILITKNVAYG